MALALKHRVEKWMPVFSNSDVKTKNYSNRPIPKSGGC
jgi:hypothetical protein